MRTRCKNCGPLVTHGPYLSALEVIRDKALYKFMFTLLNFTVYFEARRRRGVATIAVAMTVVLSVSSMRVRHSKLLPLAACLHLYGGADRILVCGGLPGLWSRSRDGLETYQRLVSVSSREK